MTDTPQPVHSLTPREAATWLNIDPVALDPLIRAGFISVSEDGDIPLAEVKSFAARNTAGGTTPPVVVAQPEDFETLVRSLDAEIDDLSQLTHAIFSKALPETLQWSEKQREEFINQASARFSAILAVVSQGAQVDVALRRDLEEVGAGAAWAGTSLAHLQLVLRISRDLLMQSAMRLAEQSDGRWNASLDGFIARLLPGIDNLLDAIAHGYWDALLEHHREVQGRLSSIVEKLPYPIYEADLDGLLRHVNIAFTRMFQTPADQLIGMSLLNIVQTVEGDVATLLAEPDGDVGRATLVVESPIGGNVKLEVDTVVRRVDGSVEGFAGLMRVRRA